MIVPGSYRKRNGSLRRCIGSGRPPASLCGSMTVEAALVLPLFIFFMANILYIFDMIRLQSNLFAALQQTGTELTQYAYYYRYGAEDAKEAFAARQADPEYENYSGDSAAAAADASADRPDGADRISGDGSGYENTNDTGPSLGALGTSFLLSQTYVRSRVEQYLGTEYLNHSCLEGGAGSISWLRSRILMDDSDIVELVADYRVKPFIPIMAPDGFSMQSRYVGHAWTGYARTGDAGETSEDTEEEMVYITATGTVYHRSRECTYLKPSIQTVSAGSVDSARSRDGSKYYACEACRPAKTGTLYITRDGNRYHSSPSCSSLKREVREVPLSSVENSMHACSKCGH